MESIRIMLVDDHPLFLQGLQRTIDATPPMTVVCALSDGVTILERCREFQPDVILMDVNLPSQDGLSVTRVVKAALPHIKVIILTAYHDEEQLFHAIQAGASAYYTKNVMPEQLLAAVQHVYEGHYVIRDEVMSGVELVVWLRQQMKAFGTEGEIAEEEFFTPLSGREREVLGLIAKGYADQEVADHLGISRQTVRNHTSSILRKLQVNDRTQAAVYALRHGWIRLQDTKYDR